MKTSRIIPLSVLALLVLPFGLNAKPEFAGKGDKMSESTPRKDDAKTMADGAKGKAEKGKSKAEDEAKEKAEKAKVEKADAEKKAKAELEGKKAEQERKEIGKGSEKGQAQRAEKSRKWWKFWGGDKTAE